MHSLFRRLRHATARTLSRMPALAAMAVLLPSHGVDLQAPRAAASHGVARTAVVVPATTTAGELPKTEFSIVTPEYFRASGVRLVRGRMFDAGDRADGPPVVIVNEALARRYWPDEDPIGQVVTLDAAGDDDPVAREVVGVVTNVRRAELDADAAAPAVYLPLAQSPYPFL